MAKPNTQNLRLLDEASCFGFPHPKWTGNVNMASHSAQRRSIKILYSRECDGGWEAEDWNDGEA